MKVLWASLLLLLVLCQMSLTRALDDDELRDNQGVNDDDAVIPGSQVRVTFTLPPRDTPNATEAPGNATNATMAPTDPCANYTGPEMVLVTLSLSNSTGNDTATWDNSTTSDGVDGNSTASNMTAMPTNATYEYVYDDLYYLCTPADDSSNATEGGNFTNTSRTEVPASTPGAASGQTSFSLPPQTIPPTESPTQGSEFCAKLTYVNGWLTVLQWLRNLVDTNLHCCLFYCPTYQVNPLLCLRLAPPELRLVVLLEHPRNLPRDPQLVHPPIDHPHLLPLMFVPYALTV